MIWIVKAGKNVEEEEGSLTSLLETFKNAKAWPKFSYPKEATCQLVVAL